MGSLEQAVVVVTGASRGIGRAIAEELGFAGAKVVVNYIKSKDAAEVLVSRLQQGGTESLAIQADVSDPLQAVRLIEETIQRLSRIDVLVNNAGINLDHSIKKLTTEEWDRVIADDLSSCFYTVKAALPYFLQQKSGKIINISSMNGEVASFGQANYTAAKAGIIGFTRTAALELAHSNVTVNAVCPGYIATEMFESIPEKSKEAIIARIPLGRPGRPDEVARGVRYLIVDGEYITGTTLDINGGAFMH